MLLAMLSVAVGGCTTLRKPLAAVRLGPELSIRSLTIPGRALKGRFETGLFSYDGRSRLTVLLYEGQIDDPQQAITIRMFWRPGSASTSRSTIVTNATVHYVIFTGNENESVGIYSGAGFLHPKSKLGKAELSANLKEVTLNLTERSDGFADLLGQAVLEGPIYACMDAAALDHALRQLNIKVRQQLGHPRMVRAQMGD